MSSMSNHGRSWKEVCDELWAMGARPVRTKGSHEQWRFDDGDVFTVVCRRPHDSVPPSVLASFRRLCHRRASCQARVAS